MSHAIDERIDEAKAGHQCDPVPAEPFDGPLVALRHRADSSRDHHDDDEQNDEQEDEEAA
jgi:hypothetical protein